MVLRIDGGVMNSRFKWSAACAVACIAGCPARLDNSDGTDDALVDLTGGVDSGTTDSWFGDLSTLQVFPADNPWNQDVSALPLHPNSEALLTSIGLDRGLHPDFGTYWEGGPIGFSYIILSDTAATFPVAFEYADESDPGPYPIPLDAPIEGGNSSDGDRHVLAVDPVGGKLYELFAAYPLADGWQAGSGAIWDLNSNASRPDGWTSADAAGLPIFPGLVRYDEVVERGEIRHALRFTVSRTRRAYIHPATHQAGSTDDENVPPMGLRVRLRADFDESGFPANVQVILRAMKTYGMIVADNGSNWYVSGAHDPRWDDEELSTLRQVTGRDFEVVYTGEPVAQ
jgi:hypothetical protein